MGQAPRWMLCFAVMCLVTQSCLTLCDPMDYSPPGSSVHGDSLGKNTVMGSVPSSRGSSNPGIKPSSPTLQLDSLPSEPLGKPKNTGVGILSIFQGIFLTQESNWGLLHCRQILYQVSYQRSPKNKEAQNYRHKHWQRQCCVFTKFCLIFLFWGSQEGYISNSSCS